MGDFFDSRKHHYVKEKEPKHNNIECSGEVVRINPDVSEASTRGLIVVDSNEWDENIETIETDKRNKNSFYKYNRIKNLKWKHFEFNVDNINQKNEFVGNGGKLIKSGVYEIDGFIPQKYIKTPKIFYYEKEDRITFKWNIYGTNGELSRTESYVFLFKDRRFNICKVIKPHNNIIAGRSIVGVLNITPNFLEVSNETFFSRVKNSWNNHYVLRKDFINTRTPYLNKKSMYLWNNGSKTILKHIGETLIRKAYECGQINKSSYKALKRASGLILKESFRQGVNSLPSEVIEKGVEGVEGVRDLYMSYNPTQVYLRTLVMHLKYKAYLCLLVNLRTDEEICNHWISLVKNGIGIELDGAKSVRDILRNTYNVDRVVEKITGFESKGALKGKILKDIMNVCLIHLSDLKLFKGHYQRDWVLELRGSRRISNNLSSKEKLDFVKNYCVSPKYKRRFFETYFCKCEADAYGRINGINANRFTIDRFTRLSDTMKMYHRCPVEYRPKNTTFNQLHDRLVDILNNLNGRGVEAIGMFRNLRIPIIESLVEKNTLEDSYEYDYEKSKYYNIVQALDGEKFNNYDLVIPKKAGEIREGGKILRNCLTTYVNMVENDNCLILYMKEGDVLKYAVEIRWDSGDMFRKEDGIKVEGPHFKVNQYYGVRNSLPSEEDFFGFQEYIREVLDVCEYHSRSKTNKKESCTE